MGLAWAVPWGEQCAGVMRLRRAAPCLCPGGDGPGPVVPPDPRGGDCDGVSSAPGVFGLQAVAPPGVMGLG